MEITLLTRKFFSWLWRDNMTNVCYEACKQCNLCCDYCISSDNIETSGTTTDYESIVSKISRLKPKRIVVSGGEPLLDEALYNKLQLLRASNANCYISLSSNGSIPFDFTKLVGLVDCLDISLPALAGGIYSAMRGVDKVAVVKGNIEDAKNGGLYVRISYVLTRVNKDELVPILEYAQEVGVDEVRIGRFLPLRNAILTKEKYELDMVEVNQIMETVYKKEYTFKLIPPIDDIGELERNYLNIDFNGEFFLPTKEGKKVLSEAEVEKIGNQYGVFKKLVLTDRFEGFFRPLRIRTSSENRDLVDEFYSDRTRIIHFSGFRRLQQKAQVFSLETNSNVRTRLTHSIEVSDVGRRLALRIADKLIDSQKMDPQYQGSLIAIIENACLLHDIGNPPFGHFGEAAIKKWWNDNHNIYIKAYNSRAKSLRQEEISFSAAAKKELLADFSEFDGNPQGLRNILRVCKNLDFEEKDDIQSGLNLTFPTILCTLKYIRYAGEKRSENVNKGLTKKAGYFQSERNIFDRIFSQMGMAPERKRYPFVYIMEAADDIAYAMSDIADGIEKNIMSLEVFIERFKAIWNEKQYGDIQNVVPEDVYQIIKTNGREIQKDFNNLLASRWKSILIDSAVNEFVNNLDDFLEGNRAGIFDSMCNNDAVKLLDVIKSVSRSYIYRAPEAEEIEIAGYSIILGLLSFFGRLLTLTYEEFSNFTDKDKDPAGKGLDLEWRIFNRLSKTCVYSYQQQLVELAPYFDGISFENLEWWLRAHLLVDHVSRMTDDYALKTFQNFQGIDIRFS